MPPPLNKPLPVAAPVSLSTANKPTQMVPKTPLKRWTGTALTGSSIFSLSNNFTAETTSNPASRPMIREAFTVTNAHGAVIATRPARQPLIDLGMSINGCLAGLVAITAPCAFVTVNASLIIGLLAGLLVVSAVKLLDKLKIDDPVSAVPVHLFNGVFGTICVGLFAVDKLTGAATGNGLFNGGGMTLLLAQLKGIAAVAVYTLAVSVIFWLAIKATLGLRVSKEEEMEGLDVGEHGEVAYVGFGKTAEVVHT